MREGVLSLGEKIVTAVRLATIEHVRQEMEELRLKEALSPAAQARRSDPAAPQGFVRRGLGKFKIARRQGVL